MFVMSKRLMPGLTDRIMSFIGISAQQSSQDKAIEGDDNLNQPMPTQKTIRGGHQSPLMKLMNNQAFLVTIGLAITLVLMGLRFRKHCRHSM